ncbi:MAG: ABC transporter ATP-binding protein, partial [Tissierellia bacterium]|nr:ABC transporter ATP-binding protein [Tissierellia bacterium]
NGAGKTTFFNCLANELKPKSMIAKFEDESGLRFLDPNDIGYVVSPPNVPDFLTGREFLEFIMDMHDMSHSKSTRDKKIETYFEYLDFDEEDHNKLMKDYSHGMKNKMQMIVNIITNPKILFLDEPLTTLDVVMAEKMKEMLRSMKQDYIVIFSTHIMELALDLCDEIVLLHKGKMELLPLDSLDHKDQKDRIIKALSKGDEDA